MGIHTTQDGFEEIPLSSTYERIYLELTQSTINLTDPILASQQRHQSEETLEGIEEDVENPPPPPWSASAPPPPYSRKSQHQPPSFLHRLSIMIVDFDFVSNCILVFIILTLYFSNQASDSPTSFIIPLLYLSASAFGRLSFKRKNAKTMLLYCGAYFARWCGDLAVLVYVMVKEMSSYFNMSIFSTLITLPMVGIRGFYLDLFPCNNVNFVDTSKQCVYFWSNSSAGTISGTYIFGLILFPQLIAGAIILYDCFELIQTDEVMENDIHRRSRGVNVRYRR